MKTKEEYNKYMREYHLKRYYKLKNEAFSFLGGVCSVCGNKEKLQFHHMDRYSKKFNVSMMLNVSMKKFWEEVKKCELLCLNCHQDKTRNQLNQKNGKDNHGSLTCYTHHKCRCELCKNKWNEYCKQLKRNRKLKRSHS